MQLRSDCTYALVMPTSMGVRITLPFNRQPVHTSNLYTMQAISAESNVGNIAASLGMRVKLLTTFVKDSEIARYIKVNCAGAISNSKDLKYRREVRGVTDTRSTSPTADTV